MRDIIRKKKKRVNDLKEDNLQLFMFTIKEYKRFYRQLSKSKITDSYDDITYVEINTKLMLLRKYGCNKENVYIKDIIDISIEKYPDKESQLKELLEDYLRIEKQQLEYILADGTKLNIYEAIEDVMYGVILSARIDMFSNDPPVNRSIKPKASLSVSPLNQLRKTAVFIPGTGIADPSLITQSIKKVKRIFILISLTFNAFIRDLNIRSPLLFHQVPRSSP